MVLTIFGREKPCGRLGPKKQAEPPPPPQGARDVCLGGEEDRGGKSNPFPSPGGGGVRQCGFPGRMTGERGDTWRFSALVGIHEKGKNRGIGRSQKVGQKWEKSGGSPSVQGKGTRNLRSVKHKFGGVYFLCAQCSQKSPFKKSYDR